MAPTTSAGTASTPSRPPSSPRRSCGGSSDIDRAGLFTRVEGLTTAEAKAYGRALCRRCTGTPLQHLTGEQGFRRLVLEVRPGVFVPRPETELLVEIGLRAVSAIDRPIVVDVGTGTGAVALAIADEHPGARVVRDGHRVRGRRAGSGERDAVALDVTSTRAICRGAARRASRKDRSRRERTRRTSRRARRDALPADVLADPDEPSVGDPSLYERLLDDAARGCDRRHGRVEIGDDAGGRCGPRPRRRGSPTSGSSTDLNGRARVVSGRRP